MQTRYKVLIISVGCLISAYYGLLLIGFGALEVFQPPFEIVVPQDFRGVVCATSRPGTKEDQSNIVRHEITPEGLLEVNGDILQSHRPVKLFTRSNITGVLTEIPSTQLLSNFTENDPATGEWYAVRWLGTRQEWEAFHMKKGVDRLCLGRFKREKIS